MLTVPLLPAILPHTRQHRTRQNRLFCIGNPAASVSGGSEGLLDRFWQARGVLDPGQRQRLINTAFSDLETVGSTRATFNRPAEEHEQPSFDQALETHLPGAGTAWLLDSPDVTAQVRAVSARLVQLQSLFGEDSGVDVAAMLIREPQLAAADMKLIARRLLEMRLASRMQGDMLQMIQAQPGLLLHGPSAEDAEDQEDTDEERRRAWEFGLPSDSQQDWSRRLGELQAYADCQGDAHVGFREGDAPELTRWAAKQRSDWRSGVLRSDRRAALEALGFEFDEAKAEWMRWYAELSTATDDTMLGSGLSRDLYLYNWCSVQRIAKRSGALAQDRIALLDAIAFDWAGADALS